ncbi:BppU family phage baseplate upper protein [Lachnoclostridium sp. MSJ-17]|uniref:BppU family phage baseplate upper protein n=1 Tax=Lachnoclostridium sp. MSJ-17 TaxID=2841516 RepID=UPI001C1009CE|nr:BppU family phage baseplate upper protein [Lachnoclostridium sp. MSJ-17]MBU5461613.1 phage baseplate upper protein [Lachnoclostridium sp. MSJ-17]
MNDYISEITLDLNCERSCRTIMLTQFDKGKKIHLTVKANGEPYSVSGCSVVLKGVNSDGSRVAVDCNIEQDGTATAVTDDITFAVKGFAAARFVISDSQRTYNTQRFLIYVDDALDTDVTSDPAYSILNRLIREVQLIDEHGGIIVDDELSSTSAHPVQNRIVNAALNTKAPLSTAYTFDNTTTAVPFNVNNPKIIYLNAVVDGENGIVITSAHNSGFQFFFGRNGTTKIRLRNGADTYTDWQPAAEKAANKSNAITSSNKTSSTLFPTIKAVVDYLAEKYEALSNKLTSAYGIDGDSTDAQYPTAKAVYEFGGEIVDIVNEDIAETNDAVADLKTYLGYTSGDILGLQADFENKVFTRLGAAVGKNAGSDFDVFPMYGGRRRVVVDSDGVIDDSIAPASVTETDYDLDVMVYQPKFYYKVVPLKLEKQSGGTGYHIRKANYYITSTPHAGFKVHPLFIDANGNEVDYVLLSAYEASYLHAETGNYHYFSDGTDTNTNIDWAHDVLKSMPGVKPISGQRKAMTKANMEALAQRKSSNWHLDTIKSVSANQLLMIIEMGQFNTQAAMGSGVTDTPNNGAYNCSSLTGSTTSLGNATGMAAETTYESAGNETVNTTNGKLSVSYRGLENPWGNIWKHVNGINLWGNGEMGGGQAYIADNFSFDEEAHSGNYHPAGFTIANASGWISAFAYGNEDFDWLFMPSETTGNSSLPVGDRYYGTEDMNGYYIIRHGGYWNSGNAAGGFLLNCLGPSGSKANSIGGRLLYVPTAAV